MPSGSEALGQQSALQSTLDAGIEQLSYKQRVEFQQYKKIVLAQDGFVFWVATGQFMTASGSLHYSTDRLQDADQTLAANQVLLTSEIEITQFNAVSPLTMWIGAWPVGPEEAQTFLQVAFAQRGNYYEEADIWHYAGFAVYPALSSQIIADPADIPAGPIVSNSLPIWLAQNSFAPVFPSFLVPDNLAPPYVVAHIDPERTVPLSSFPMTGPWPGTVQPNSGESPLHRLAMSQLMRDEVTLTLYGFDNSTALQFLGSLIAGSIDGSAPFGFASSPVIVDEKRVQVEIAALAQKKSIRISANYLQGAADAVARRLILSALPPVMQIIGGVAVTGMASGAQDEQTGSVTGSVNQ